MVKEACHSNPYSNLQILTQFVISHISRLRKIPGSWPAYIDDPRERIPQLLSAFQELRNRIPHSDPSFLDCGSGEGTILSIASLAGFKKTYGIELNPFLASLSKNHIKQLERKKVIDPGCVEIAGGSYYIPELKNLLVPLCQQCLKSLYDQTEEEGISFEEFVTTFLGCSTDGSVRSLVVNFLYPFSNKHPYDELRIFDKEKMKLNTDIVYIYPSDPFFESAFLPQVAHIINPSALLVVLSPTDDMICDIPHFTEESPIVLSHNLDVNMVLQTFRRNLIDKRN
jgi:hypothetical protein